MLLLLLNCYIKTHEKYIYYYNLLDKLKMDSYNKYRNIYHIIYIIIF